jgi:hypothetical protein
MPETFEQTPRPADERDAQGRLTRAGMESVLRRGESVLLGDRVITRLEDLPDEADLAAGDEARLASAREALVAQRDALDKQLVKLAATRSAAPQKADAPAAETKPPTESETKPEAEHEPKAEGDEPSGEGGPAFARPFGGRKGGR